MPRRDDWTLVKDMDMPPLVERIKAIQPSR